MGALAETIKPGNSQWELIQAPETPIITLVKTEKSFTPHDTSIPVASRRILLREITEKQITGLAALYRKGDYPLSEADAITKARLELTDFDTIDVSEVPIFIPTVVPEAITVFSAQEQPISENLIPKKPVAREKPIPRLFPKPAMA